MTIKKEQVSLPLSPTHLHMNKIRTKMNNLNVNKQNILLINEYSIDIYAMNF